MMKINWHDVFVSLSLVFMGGGISMAVLAVSMETYGDSVIGLHGIVGTAIYWGVPGFIFYFLMIFSDWRNKP
jgi:hypothetical protein